MWPNPADSNGEILNEKFHFLCNALIKIYVLFNTITNYIVTSISRAFGFA